MERSIDRILTTHVGSLVRPLEVIEFMKAVEQGLMNGLLPTFYGVRLLRLCGNRRRDIVEHPELVAWRIRNFARLVGRENVIAGTDCGFSQNWNLIRVRPTIQWAKLEALVEGSQLATGQLWG
jgi:methionine synthase II (cobalamin-independent)